MHSAARGDDETFARAAAELERELARYRVALKYRREPKADAGSGQNLELTDDTGPV